MSAKFVWGTNYFATKTVPQLFFFWGGGGGAIIVAIRHACACTLYALTDLKSLPCHIQGYR